MSAKSKLNRLNTLTLAGFVIIAMAFFMATFAYLLAPDNSTHANHQIPSIGLHSPGFEITIIKKENTPAQKTPILKSIWGGKPQTYTSIPVLSYFFLDDKKLSIKRYKGRELPSSYDTLRLKDIMPQRFLNIGKTSPKTIEQIAIEKKIIEKKKYWLGTDKYGRDIWSRILIGARVSLSVGIISVIISLIIGISLGTLAGYFGGWIDTSISWFINVFWSIPTLLMALGLLMAVKSSSSNQYILVYIAIGMTMWVDMARMVRGQFISMRKKEYIDVSKSMGYNHIRIIGKHILPNIIGPIIVIAASNFAIAILVESGLSFIGVGVQPPKPSWGVMLKEYYNLIGSKHSYLALIPGFCIMILVWAFNLLGSGLRDFFDVKG